jgi:hypothetical protein
LRNDAYGVTQDSSGEYDPSLMEREWCLVIRPASTASSNQKRLLRRFVERPGERLAWGRQGDDLLALVSGREGLPSVEIELMRLLAGKNLSGAVVNPLPIGRWNENLARYVIASPSPPRPDAVVSGDEIAWVVAVSPASPFDWLAVREVLSERGRTTVRETDATIEVGALDESDALNLIAELSEVEAISGATAQHLGWFRRWRVRQQMVGNYTSQDPTQPL